MFKPGSDAHLKKIALWNGNVFQMENLRIILSGLSAEESLLLKKEFKWSVIKVMISIIKTRSSLIYFLKKGSYCRRVVNFGPWILRTF